MISERGVVFRTKRTGPSTELQLLTEVPGLIDREI